MKTKVIIFGAGANGLDAYLKIKDNFEILAFVDNNPELQGTHKEGIQVLRPERSFLTQADDVLIASIAWREIAQQLVTELSVPIKKVTVFDNNYLNRRLDTELLLSPLFGESLQKCILGSNQLLVRDWRMSFSEMAALKNILEYLKPQVSVELGTFRGGSLSLIEQYSENSISLDIHPDSRDLLQQSYPKTEYIIGNTRNTLSKLIERFNSGKEDASFFLVDADHRRAAVTADINDILAYKPKSETYVLMHDSFHPDCRAGIIDAKWEDSPYVQLVELDFVPGSFSPHPLFNQQMWGGFALALLSPNKRECDLNISATHQVLFDNCLPHHQ